MSDRSKLVEESEEPDSLDARLREMIASGELKEAAGQAIAAQLARGFPVTFQRGDAVVRLFPDGHEEFITSVPITTYKLPPNVAIVKNR